MQYKPSQIYWIVINDQNVNCNIIEFKVLKLIVNCLSLISFQLRIRSKKIKFRGILHINAKLHGVFIKRDVD